MSILDNGELKDDQYCFACGQHNPHGLGMRVEYPEPEALCRITLTAAGRAGPASPTAG